MNLISMTLVELREALRDGKTTSVEATQAMLDLIIKLDNQVKSYITISDELALEQAQIADDRRSRGDDSLLLGIPVAVKDIICTKGVETTAGSKILKGFTPPYDAFVVEKLKQAGAVILGKTNTDEFAMGSSTENSAYFTSLNPWNLERVPGGSSGGSAAAVAGGMAYGALGRIRGAAYDSPPPFAAWLDCARPTVGYPDGGLWPLLLRLIRSGLSAGLLLIAPPCFKRRRVTIDETAQV